MENIPRIIDAVRLPVNIPIHAYLLDHHVEGQVVFPAVKAMQVIGETVKRFRPETDISVMTRTRFDKFLHIHSDADQITAFVDIDIHENGDIAARLLTKNRFKKSSMIRIKEHAFVYYPRDPSGFAARRPDPVSDLYSALEGTCIEISPHRIYDELVPFGPAFRSIQGRFLISEQGVIAGIGTPADYASQSISEALGSPFPLDAAYHGACVWGQRYAGVVAFPVGFEKRKVWHHTLPGKAYFCWILPVQTHPDLLVFDLWIYDENGVLFESSLGVCMKDVSAGRMKPPQWITAAKQTEKTEGYRENGSPL
ncbi:MAG: polyketide synthase dehydratase domain-containing protein [Deltaproteobacteria bacterium]|nr:polyketide synthase dehydratase domain-containing protein [Deltaproteobacteria bacterium]